MTDRIIIVDANVSLKPYLSTASETSDFEAHLEKLGFEVREEEPSRKIGFLEAASRGAS